jgi:hypothetical protein
LAEIAKNHEKAGVKLDPSQDLVMGRQGVSGEIGKLAGVSHETVRKVEKILASESITDKVKQDLRLDKVSINEAYKIVELDQEGQSLHQKFLKAYDEMEKSYAEIYNRPERTKEETDRLRAQGKEKLWEKPYRNSFEKRLEFYKAYAAFYFWCQYRTYKNSDTESASKTLKEIVGQGIDDGIQTFPWQTIEKILHHAAAENKMKVDKIRDSKGIQAELELIRLEQAMEEKELAGLN